MRLLFMMLLSSLFFNCYAQKTLPTKKLQQLLDKSINNKTVFGTQVSILTPTESWTGAAGNLDKESSFYIASTTKLYVTAVIMHYRSLGKLTLEDTLGKYLPQPLLKGLHVLNGNDYSHVLTIRHLLAHTSGLPDYFLGKLENGNSLYGELTKGNDQSWDVEKAIALSKTMKPLFVPGEPGKANYSDANFQLLDAIIEKISGKKLEEVFQELIYKPLGLSKTYIYSDINDKTPKVMYYKDQPLPIPKAMTSFQGDGGIVSNSQELLIFLKGFFNGTYFPAAYLEEMKEFNPIMFPLENGVGMMRFKLPRIFSPFKAMPVCYGHSGLSGAFAYYCPEKNVFITGTVNQISQPQLSYQIMLKLLMAF